MPDEPGSQHAQQPNGAKPHRPPPPSPAELEKRFKEHLKAKEGDVVIWAFNRSGTHWLNEILWMLIHETLDPAPRKEKSFLDFVEPEEYSKIEGTPRILNTHFPYPTSVAESIQGMRLVYVLREPRDAIVSMYNAFFKDRNTWSEFWDELFGDMLNNSQIRQGKLSGEFKRPNLDWFENYVGFKEYAGEKELMSKRSVPFLKVKYEDLKAQPRSEIVRIASYLGVKRSDEFIDSVVEKTSIDQMRKSHAKDYQDKIFDHDRDMHEKHFRKGQVGDWKNWLTVAQNEQFEELYRSRMGAAVYEDL